MSQPLFASKTIVVLGGGSGMGLATARLCAENGARVVILGRSQAKLDAARQTIPGESQAVAVDAEDGAALAACFERLGAIDGLVTSAANVKGGTFMGSTPDEAHAAFEGKFWLQYRAARLAASRIRPNGSIVFFSGVAAHRYTPGLSVVAAVNGAVEGLTRSLAVELGPDVRVNCVCPGIVDTPVYAGMDPAAREGMFAAVAQALPVKRIGAPEDVAQAVVFLLSNRFTTGSVLMVDGGRLVS